MPTGVSDAGTVVLTVDDVAISVWKGYEFSCNFLSPTDDWWFTLGDDLVGPDLIRRLVPGSAVKLSIDGNDQAAGYIRKRSIRTGRAGGTEILITGSDAMWPVTESTVMPGQTFPETETLGSMIERLLRPFGFIIFAVDNADNRNRITGAVTHAKHKDAANLRTVRLNAQKPKDHETIFSYLSRVAQREGMWIWPSADGLGVIVSKPNYDQAPRYTLRHRVSGAGNNILAGEVFWDASDQPSYLMTSATIPAGDREERVVTAYTASPFESRTLVATGPTGTTTTLGAIALIADKHMVEVPSSTINLARQNAFASKVSRPRYLRDQSSQTVAQLEAFTRREMSLLQRRAFGARYTISGHKLDGQVVGVDTVIDVDDDRSDLHAPMWVAGRTLRRDRNGGTTTELDLLPLGALAF